MEFIFWPMVSANWSSRMMPGVFAALNRSMTLMKSVHVVGTLMLNFAYISTL